MSLDTLGRRAAQDLRAAASTSDVERSLQQALDRDRRRPWKLALLVAATAIAVVVAWLATTDLFPSRHSAPPADGDAREVVGVRLSVPVEAAVPQGWVTSRDAASVELRPADGSDRSITLVGQPVVVYEPPSYDLKPLREDLVVWTRTHPDLRVSDDWGIDGPDFAWTGTEMRLSVPPGTEAIPLVPLPSDAGRLTVTSGDGTFLWDVIYLADSPPLLVASRSPVADDQPLKTARDELLESLTITAPPN